MCAVGGRRPWGLGDCISFAVCYRCRPVLHTGADKLRLVHLPQSCGHSESKAPTSILGVCMDPPNPEWNFLKDLLGEKPFWKQQEENCIPGWAEPRGLVSTVSGERHLGVEDCLVVSGSGKRAWLGFHVSLGMERLGGSRAHPEAVPTEPHGHL